LDQKKIKICGIKDLEIAKFCISLDVDYLGFNFSPVSKRKIELMKADQIINNLKKKFPTSRTKLVALFYKTEPNLIEEIVHSNLFDVYQYVQNDTSFQKKEHSLIYLPQIQIDKPTTDLDLLDLKDELIIIDSYEKNLGGGSGKVFPWEYAKGIQRKYLLAGGLNSLNVNEAIQTLNPYGVDVASGVENSKGEKDINLIESFVKNVRQ
jgi:phosphoribosylanthranilate isomerase